MHSRPFRKGDLSVKYEGMLDDQLRQQFLGEGLNPLLIPPVVKTAEVTYLNKIYKGFGIKNRFGGLEFYCSDLPINEKVKGPVTIDQPCQTLYPLKQNIRSRMCCLFMDWLDYLSYLTLSERDRVGEYPTDCDCIVMNDTRNFVSMMIDADDYDHVYCFFPHSYIGQVMEQTLQSRSGNHYTMKSYLYEGYLNLHEYAKNNPQKVEEDDEQ